jgi:hypothetical protein
MDPFKSAIIDPWEAPAGSDTLARNVALLQGVVATKKNAQLYELQSHDHFGHDHFAMMTGERRPSSQFIRIVVDWLTHASRAAQLRAPTGAASAPRR